MKTLSVIIPLYNSARWLPKCLDSVLCQDIPEEELEVICVNDGSPDNSAEIVRSYQELHPKSIVLLEQENQGPSGARNNGMRHATAKYLSFVDPDDYVEPNVFGGLLRQMEEQQLDILRFNYQIVDEDYKPVKKRQFELQFDYSPCTMTGAEFLAKRLDIACNIWRYLYRTELITSNHIWCFTGDYFDDTPWLPLVLMKAQRLAICDTVVYDYQERSDSLVKAISTSAVKRKNEGCFLLIHLLKEELKGIDGGEVLYSSMNVLRSVSFEPSIREAIVRWYEMIIAHVSVSLMTRTAAQDYKSTGFTLEQLRDKRVFPLSIHGASSKNKSKIWMLNVFPRLFCLLVHLKNR